MEFLESVVLLYIEVFKHCFKIQSFQIKNRNLVILAKIIDTNLLYCGFNVSMLRMIIIYQHFQEMEVILLSSLHHFIE